MAVAEQTRQRKTTHDADVMVVFQSLLWARSLPWHSYAETGHRIERKSDLGMIQRGNWNAGLLRVPRRRKKADWARSVSGRRLLV
jgi:hypothetical protein